MSREDPCPNTSINHVYSNRDTCSNSEVIHSLTGGRVANENSLVCKTNKPQGLILFRAALLEFKVIYPFCVKIYTIIVLVFTVYTCTKSH